MPLTKIDDRGLTTPVDLLDNEKIRLGTGNDFELYHNGTRNIVGNNTAQLRLITDTFRAVSKTGDETYITADANGAVELYYNGSNKFQTVTDGVRFTGHLHGNDNYHIKLGNGNDLQLYHDGSNSYIEDAGTGDLIASVSASNFRIRGAGNAEIAKFGDDGSVDLYHNGSKKFETTATGVTISNQGNNRILNVHNTNGNNSYVAFLDQNTTDNSYVRVGASANDMMLFAGGSEALRLTSNRDVNIPTDGKKLQLGASQDLEIFHDGSHSWVDNNTGHLYLRNKASNQKTIVQAGLGGNVELNVNYGEHGVVARSNGASELYYDNALRLETMIAGARVKRYGGGATTLFIEGAENSSAILDMFADDGDDNADKFRLQAVTDGSFTMQNYAAGSWENNIRFIGNGAVELYYDNSKKFETLSNGAEVHGHLHLGDNYELRLGNVGSGGDLKLYHNGSASYIHDSGTGELIVKSNSLSFTNDSENEYLARFFQDSGVELYNNGTKKWATGSNGVYHDCNGTLHQQAIHFESGQNTGDYGTLFGVTNYPDASGFGDQNDGHWARIQSKGGTVVVINSDAGGRNDGRNTFDHFSVYQRAGDSTNGKRLFSVDGAGQAQFGRAGIRIDNSWGGQPSITVQRNNNDGTDNTDNSAYMRVHGIGETHESWTGGSTGADFSANFLIDGSNYHTSDRRAKTDIVDCPYGLDVVNKLQPRKYQLVNSQLTPQGPDNINLGFIAQEIKEHIPECVNYLGDEANTPNEKGYAKAYGLDIGEVVPVLVKAIQELSAKVAALEAK